MCGPLNNSRKHGYNSQGSSATHKYVPHLESSCGSSFWTDSPGGFSPWRRRIRVRCRAGGEGWYPRQLPRASIPIHGTGGRAGTPHTCPGRPSRSTEVVGRLASLKTGRPSLDLAGERTVAAGHNRSKSANTGRTWCSRFLGLRAKEQPQSTTNDRKRLTLTEGGEVGSAAV